MISIANTTITEKTTAGEVIGYRIEPNNGYFLHDINLDFEITDEHGHPTGETKRGYINAACICPVSYDFENTKIIDSYTAYGNREFFARPQSEVPTNQIFSLPNNHEVMSDAETETE